MSNDRRRFLRLFSYLVITLLVGKTITACNGDITIPQYQLTVAGAGTGNGSVTSGSAGINCTIAAGVTSNDCSVMYDDNTQVTLTAAAAAGSTFDGWSGACSGTAACQVTMSQARSVTATFEVIPEYDLMVDGGGSGNGSVASNVAGISCTVTAGVASGDCDESYEDGTAVTLTATADAGSRFASWSGACSGTGTCQVTMSQARSVTATFELQYELTVAGAGTGNGGVTSVPAGISCTIAAAVASDDCSESYDDGTSVTLTAVADAGSAFDGWSGAGCSGTGTCQVTMDQARNVTATFELQHELTVDGVGAGNGTVTSAPAGVSCTITAGVATDDCSESYDDGTAVTLTAVAGAGSTFDGWSGACSGTGTCQVTMTQPWSATATFESCGLTSSADADADGLPDCVETNTMVFVSQLDTGTDPNNPDTDGDAISDGDEVLGTSAGLNLPLMGVSPLRQDILIEYDWFDDALECPAHSHLPTAAAVSLVATAFANAPVLNPDGSTGINLIQDYGQGGVFTGGTFIADVDGVLIGGVGDAEFLGYKSTNLDANRNGYFHYTILPHRYNTNSGSSGQAEYPGDDMIVSLYCSGTDQNVANTIMHELGHNLLLHHGGFEGTNYKPNYNSVMNYKYQFLGIDNNCTPPGDGVLDYSIGVRPQLDENNLDETQGVCGDPPGPPWDWNQDGDATDVGLVWDINVDGTETGDGLFQILQDYNDWAFLVFTGIFDADGAALRQVREIVSCVNPAPIGRR
jgi:hypothetical protein